MIKYIYIYTPVYTCIYLYIYIYIYTYMGVSQNGGTPKSCKIKPC